MPLGALGMIIMDCERVVPWVAERTGHSAELCGVPFAVGVERSGEIVAGIVTYGSNGVNAMVEIAIDKQGKDTFDLLRAYFKHVFIMLGLKRLTATVPQSRPDLLAFDLHVGFKEEFLMQDAAPDGGALHVIVMRAQDCRWLEGEYART